MNLFFADEWKTPSVNAPLANLFELFEFWYIESIRNDWFFREKILNKLEEYSNYDFGIKVISEKYDNDKKIK